MPKIDPNDPAFPHLHDSCQRINESEHWEGLTKREEFAKAAMQAIIWAHPGTTVPRDQIDQFRLDQGREAVKHADALISALNEEKP